MVLDRAVIMNWIYLLLGLGAIVGLLYYYFGVGRSQYTASAMVAGPISLSAETQLLKSADAELFYMKPEGTFQGFFYLNAMNRTGTYTSCGTNPNQPSCTDGTFAPCPCGGSARNDCITSCAHPGYEHLISIAGIAKIEVLTVPDASRQGKAMAQLVITTEGPRTDNTSGKQTYIETIPLPSIPMQKWTMITICREGRRYDVYYDNTLVVSKKTLYMPVTDPISTNLKGILSGSSALAGEVALVDVESRRYTMSEVAASFSRKADTRGSPYVASNFTAGYGDSAGFIPTYAGAASLFSALRASIPSVNPCPEGNCLNVPVVRPISSTYDWTTSYA